MLLYRRKCLGVIAMGRGSLSPANNGALLPYGLRRVMECGAMSCSIGAVPV